MLFTKKENKIDKIEARQTVIDAKIEEKKSISKLKTSKNNAKIKRLEEKNAKIVKAEADFIEKMELEFEKNIKLIYAEAEYAKKLGEKYQTREKLKKARVKKSKEIAKTIKQEYENSKK